MQRLRNRSMFRIIETLVVRRSLRNMETVILVGSAMWILRLVPLSYSWLCVALDLLVWERVAKTNGGFILQIYCIITEVPPGFNPAGTKWTSGTMSLLSIFHLHIDLFCIRYGKPGVLWTSVLRSSKWRFAQFNVKTSHLVKLPPIADFFCSIPPNARVIQPVFIVFQFSKKKKNQVFS